MRVFSTAFGSPGRPRRALALVLALLALAIPSRGSAQPTKETRLKPDRGISRLSRFDPYDTYSDVWGYTSPDGREYALLGSFGGVSVVNISDPRRPFETGFFPLRSSAWRDIKTFGDFAYAVTEGGGGLAILDLFDPDNPTLAHTYAGFWSAHNLYIDESRARAYIAGPTPAPGTPFEGLRILSLANPVDPVEVGRWDEQYAHDVYVRDDVLYVSAILDGELAILDVADPGSISRLGTIANYPTPYTHNAWLTEDGSHVMITDEYSGAFCRLWDVTNPQSPTLSSTWRSPTSGDAIVHNAIIEGDLAYVSYYTAGVRIVDVSAPRNPYEIALFDTFPDHDAGIFDGCWGVFPFYPNSPGRFVCSDITRGLYVFELHPPRSESSAPRLEKGIHETSTLEIGPPVPNPARVNEPIEFALGAGAGAVTARVYDVRGRLVRKLDAGTGSGPSRVRWDGRTEGGSPVSAGVYFVRFEFEGREQSRRITIVD